MILDPDVLRTPEGAVTTTIQWRGSVEALAEDLRALVPPSEWPKFLALFMPRTEPRPMPAYLARFPAGPVAREWQGDPPPPAPVPRLSTRARKVLATLSIAEPRDVVGLKRLDFVKVRGCGAATLAEVIAWAGEYGAHLNEQPTKTR